MKQSNITAGYLNTKDLAIYLSLSEDTIRSWVKRGELPYYKFGGAVRFGLLEIEKWTKKRKCSCVYEQSEAFS